MGRFTPNGNFLFSDTFAGDKIGILVSAAYAETKSRSDEVTVWGWEGTYLDPCQFDGGPVCGTVLRRDTTTPVWFIQDYGVYQIHNWQMRENFRAVAQWRDGQRLDLNAWTRALALRAHHGRRRQLQARRGGHQGVARPEDHLAAARARG